jgi:hypothetical protein
MNFACRIKVKGTDRYLGPDLKECTKEEAPIMRQEVAEGMARKRFGPRFEKHVEIEEAAYTEWMSHIGRKKKGQRLSDAQRNHLSQLHNRWGYRKFRVVAKGQWFYVNTKSSNEGVELLARAGVKIHPQTFWRNSEELKSTPDCMRGHDLTQPMIFAKNGKYQWRKVK